MTLPFRPQASTGVIQAHVDRVIQAYGAQLNNLGYSASLFSNLRRTARHMITWITVNESDVAALDIRGVHSFLSHDCDCPVDFRSQLNDRSRWQVQNVLGYLIETGQAIVRRQFVHTRRSYDIIVWPYRSALKLAEFDGGLLQRFLDHDCACPHPQFFAQAGAFSGSRDVEARLARFASFLVERGVVADWRDPVPGASRGVHVDAFFG